MTRITRGYFDSAIGQIHFRHCGIGEPLLLLHQSPLSSTQFESVMPGLATKGFECLAIDLPGFGNSDAAPEPVTLDHFRDAAIAAMNAFEWRRAHVVGHHTGAVIAAMLAVALPQRMLRIILNGFPLLTDEERAHYATFKFGTLHPSKDGSHLLKAWDNRLRSSKGWNDLNLMNRYCIEGLIRNQTNWKAFPLIVSADLTQLLQALTTPTLLLTNTGEDLYASTQRARDLRPDFFEFAALSGGTHDIVDEQPQEWVRLVTDFLLCPSLSGKNL